MFRFVKSEFFLNIFLQRRDIFFLVRSTRRKFHWITKPVYGKVGCPVIINQPSITGEDTIQFTLRLVGRLDALLVGALILFGRFLNGFMQIPQILCRGQQLGPDIRNISPPVKSALNLIIQSFSPAFPLINPVGNRRHGIVNFGIGFVKFGLPKAGLVPEIPGVFLCGIVHSLPERIESVPDPVMNLIDFYQLTVGIDHRLTEGPERRIGGSDSGIIPVSRCPQRGVAAVTPVTAIDIDTPGAIIFRRGRVIRPPENLGGLIVRLSLLIKLFFDVLVPIVQTIVPVRDHDLEIIRVASVFHRLGVRSHLRNHRVHFTAVLTGRNGRNGIHAVDPSVWLQIRLGRVRHFPNFFVQLLLSGIKGALVLIV